MSELDFNNTQIAFAHKSDAELKKARLLFKSFNYPILIKYGPSIASFFIGFLPFVKSIIKNTLFAQFCGGENIKECEATTNILSKSNIGTILDYSVEGEENESAFDVTRDEIIATIKKAQNKEKEIPFSVFKVTGIARMELLTKINANQSLTDAETKEFEAVKERFNSICEMAHRCDVKLFVDAEDSWIQDVIDDLTYHAMSLYNKEKAIVYNTIQCYRTGRVQHIQNKISQVDYYLGFKLVRGAYMEKERARALEMKYTSPIHINKNDTDNEYNNALRLCIRHTDKVSICAGTHNELSSLLLAQLIEENGLSKKDARIYFAQLLGMSDHISYNLSHAGYNVAKYVPYGPVKAVLPYLSRRAQENSSVKGQVGRELNLIQIELKRRA
jgi:proline dehydrogenase